MAITCDLPLIATRRPAGPERRPLGGRMPPTRPPANPSSKEACTETAGVDDMLWQQVPDRPTRDWSVNV